MKACNPVSESKIKNLKSKIHHKCRIGILSDDLTGAGDAGLAFACHGVSTEIGIFNGPQCPKAPFQARVWIIDTESRHLPGPAAQKRIRLSIQALSRWGADFYYKKIDSTLRGPVREELEEFIKALPGAPKNSSPMAFVPAFPKTGRTTRQGLHFVHNKLLHQTAFSQDPQHPIRSSKIANILRTKAGSSVSNIWVPDIRHQQDLRKTAWQVMKGRTVFSGAAVGSAGLAEELARLLLDSTQHIKDSGDQAKYKSQYTKPVMVVVGSAHPLSKEQTIHLTRTYGKKVQDLSQKQAGKIKKAQVYLIKAPDTRAQPKSVMRSLVRQVKVRAKQLAINCFVATGGETAHALSCLWKQFQWRVIGRVDTGVPLCVSASRSQPFKKYWMVMKPGGFGKKNILVKCVRKLQNI